MAKFIGALIRRERLRQNYSQEGLCRGICAVSYLSKIEQGKAEAGADILIPLLKRLGISYETDPDFLRQAEAAVEALYDALLSGMSDLPPFQEKLEWLQAHWDRCMASPYMLDALLLNGYKTWSIPPEAGEFAACMTNRQRALYLLLRLCIAEEDTADELLRLAPCGFYTYKAGVVYFVLGRYLEAVDLLARSYDLAAREGNVHVMCEAKMYLGNCYTETGQGKLMLEQYRVARKLAAALGRTQLIQVIDYNVGSTYLEWGMADKAYAVLRNSSRQDALYLHKLAIALEKLGRREEALSAVEQARAQNVKPAVREMLDLVEYRLRHPDYLHDSVYSEQMTGLFELLRRTMSDGFVRFHLPYMLEVLEAERRYKDAYRLSVEFSELSSFLKSESLP